MPPVMTNAFTLPEEVLLLGYAQSASGKVWSPAFDRAAGVARLLELMMRGRLVADPKTLELKIRDATPTGDPELDSSLATFSELTKRRLVPWTVVPNISSGSAFGYTQRLMNAGVLRVESVQRRWRRAVQAHRLVDPAVATSIQQRIATALAAPERTDLQTVMLVRIAAGTDGLCGAISPDSRPIRGHEGRTPDQMKRAQELPETFCELIDAGRVEDPRGTALACCKAVDQAVARIPSEYHLSDWGGG
jgi:Golgi phosphoprotein 3 GPP34